MARPKKNTVDYFPHDCHPNKELEIFISKHGNEGYAFYYRLFELLGVTPDHRYDCNKSVNYQYLLTKTGVKEDSFEQLMISLVDLDIVNEKQWGKKMDGGVASSFLGVSCLIKYDEIFDFVLRNKIVHHSVNLISTSPTATNVDHIYIMLTGSLNKVFIGKCS